MKLSDIVCKFGFKWLNYILYLLFGLHCHNMKIICIVNIKDNSVFLFDESDHIHILVYCHGFMILWRDLQ